MENLRRRRPGEPDRPVSESEKEEQEEEDKNRGEGSSKKDKKENKKKEKKKWSCIDNCCWLIGFICSMWWLLLFLYKAVPSSLPQYVTEAITGPLPDPPGEKLRKEGFTAEHPVVFVPGIVTAGLELWEGKPCADGLFRKRLWGGTFGEVYKRYFYYFSLIFCFMVRKNTLFGNLKTSFYA